MEIFGSFMKKALLCGYQGMGDPNDYIEEKKRHYKLLKEWCRENITPEILKTFKQDNS